MICVQESRPECVGGSSVFKKVLETADTISSRECTVVLLGESGTGKELMARYIHAHSPRSEGPFVPVDCTNLSEELFASQLFGHVKGAFTSADQDALGFFCAAEEGTIFLDEISELPLNVQGKFLRVLQELKVTPVGSTVQFPINARVICATNRNLDKMVEEGKFRSDLYYRLKVLEIQIPPLRDRRKDIMQLAEYFLRKQYMKYREPVKTLSREVVCALEGHDWPGNVRQLANVIEHAYVLSRSSSIMLTDLPEEIGLKSATSFGPQLSEVIPFDQAQRALVISALRAANGNQSEAARMLQIERRRLYRMVDRYQLKSLVG